METVFLYVLRFLFLFVVSGAVTGAIYTISSYFEEYVVSWPSITFTVVLIGVYAYFCWYIPYDDSAVALGLIFGHVMALLFVRKAVRGTI